MSERTTNNEIVIDTNHTGFYERNPQRASKGDSDKGIKLIFMISPATFVQATLSFRGTVTLTYERMNSMADLRSIVATLAISQEILWFI